ncbi:MAG: sodium-dependent transporter [Pyramidobacter sp.]|jgi:NSS family neurotransmitter:Na+ symporter
MERESFKSRLGFILVSAGCAIGIGNVWKFPWLTGQNGGGFFVLIYLLFLLCMGIPVMTMELAVGRASRASAIKAYEKLAPAGSFWYIHGWFALAGNYLLMMYYTTVSGWMLSYFYKFAVGAFDGMDSEKIGGAFSAMLGNLGDTGTCMVLTVLVGFLICSMGIRKGLEKVTKWMMLGLLLLIVILVVHSLLLPGADEGVRFYLHPSVERMKDVGAWNVIMGAMNQSFFTLSLGIASMEIFGSYMSDDHTLAGEAVRIVSLDTFVALMAGLIIFPACFSFGVKPDAGPSLIFLTLPRVFASMVGGRFWGTLFFLFMTFASFSTVIAVFENLIANCMDSFGWKRSKAVWLNCAFVLVASIPCVLDSNLWSGLHIIGDRGVLDSEDFLVSNLLLPLGSLTYLLFCVTRWGWGFDRYLAECNKGEGIKLSPRFKPFFQFVLPVLILLVLIEGLI